MYKKNFYGKMSLRNVKTLRKCGKNLQFQMSELQVLETLIFPELLEVTKLSKFLQFFLFKILFFLHY